MEKYLELLELAREAIRTKLEDTDLIINDNIKKKYSKKQSCFVTLTLKSQLRGCIGSIVAHQELWKDVVDNARSSAFNDSRFLPLSKNEFNKIKIEVSILSIPKKISFFDSEDLKRKINNKGVILKKGFYSATYLPQVWEEIQDSEEFLSSLCIKAGLSPDSWKEKGLEVWTYSVESIKE